MAKAHFTFRLAEEDRRRLAAQAADESTTESELARRYVLEGMRMARHPAIRFRTHRTGRRPALATRPRLDIADLIETWKLEGRDAAATAEYFEISDADVAAALRYYQEFREEIDASLAEKQAAADRLERESAHRRA